MSTVKRLIDGGYCLTAHCGGRECHHSTTLDLIALRERLGPDHSTMHVDLAHKLRCTACGHRGVTLILSPPTKAGIPRGVHGGR